MGELYKLTFANGKSYIGMTIHSSGARFKSHSDAARRGTPYQLYDAWRKYGPPTMEVLAVVDDVVLPEAEKQAIKFHATKPPKGYNILSGGNMSPTQDPEVAARVSAKLLGRPRPPDVRRRIGLGNRGKAWAAGRFAHRKRGNNA